MNDRILNIAIEEAMKSEYEQRMAAVCFRKKRIISKGHNDALSCDKHHHPKFRKWSTSIHAEVAAILNAKRDLCGCDMLVIRINNNADLRRSIPCQHCMNYLHYVGIRNVWCYNGCEFECINVS